MAKYVYPAIFEKDELGGFAVTFPDIENCFTQGNDLNDAITMAEDVLNLILWTLEDDKQPIPSPTPISQIQADGDSFVSYIQADTIAYRKKHSPKAVKKTLSIPQWMNQMALDAHINFSQVLQDALAQKLNIA